MTFADRLLVKSETRSDPAPISLGEYYQFFSYGGINYSTLFGQTLKSDREEIETNFEGFVAGALKASGPVYTAIRIRQALFSEARPMWRDLIRGRPGDLSWTPELEKFRHPMGPGTGTGDLMAINLLDLDLAGNSYTTRRPSKFKRLRPDWTSIVLGIEGEVDADPNSLDAEVVGYIFHPGGKLSSEEPVSLLKEEVAHFIDVPDPAANFRGMSWLQPVVNEILGDRAATKHKLKFFENGATPNLAITLDPDIAPEKAKEWLTDFREHYGGHTNAYKTLALAGGADVKVVGADFRQLDFKVTQGYGESRIFNAAGIHPVVAGSAEGLQGSSLNAGNYGQSKRSTADITLRTLWRKWCGSFETLVPPPDGKELWYDDSDIKFLQEDLKDAADIQSTRAQTIASLIREGFTAESAIAAVTNDDLTLLKHTGQVSVQLQPGNPQANGEPDDTD